jgi:hypothetical protein
MSERNDSILAVLNREPEQSQLLLKVGLAGPAFIVIWDWVGGYFLPDIAVAAITLLVIVVYGAALTFLAARLIHSADKWEVESAMQARRLLTGGSNNRRSAAFQPDATSADEIHPPPIEVALPAVSVNFAHIYFMLRLQEEVARCRREGESFSLVCIEASTPGVDPTPAMVEKTAFEIAHLAVSHGRMISLPLNVGPSEYVFCLPHANHEEGRDFLSKLVRALGDYWCHYGLAVYPEHGTDAESLFLSARRQTEESRQGRSPSGAKATAKI